jgi:cytidylate kinase
MKVAIDGPAGSGKTSLARALAEHFGWRFVETGKLYRAVALAVSRGRALDEIDLRLTRAGRVLVNGEDVSDLLHTSEVDQASSRVAAIPEVRAKLLSMQREIAERESVVMEGRDIGTVVLPDADVKIFLAASAEERARRRAMDHASEDIETTRREIEVRDRRDSTREIAPLSAASDATILDTDRKPLAEVISEAISLVKERLDGRCTAD